MSVVGGGVERPAGCLLLTVVLSGLGRRRLFGKVIDLGAAAGPLPYRICRAVRIASTAERITIGYRRRVRVAEGGILAARFVLRNTSSAGSAGSVGIPVAAAGSMCRSAVSRGRSISSRDGCCTGRCGEDVRVVGVVSVRREGGHSNRLADITVLYDTKPIRTDGCAVAKGPKRGSLRDLSGSPVEIDDWPEVFDEVHHTSDRTAAIVLASWVERSLEQSIIKALPKHDYKTVSKLLERDGALNSFYSKSRSKKLRFMSKGLVWSSV